MNTVNTIQELRKSLTGDGQGSGTLQGWVNYQGKDLYVRKHWSYSGGFPVYTGESCETPLGELTKDGEAFPYIFDGEPQYEHGYKEWKVWDFKISFNNGN